MVEHRRSLQRRRFLPCADCRTLTIKSVGGYCHAMTRSDLEIANDFVRRWGALSKQRRARLGGEIPVAALQVAALSHPNLAIRRSCLFLLDHYASDASWNVFRLALRDPVASVREVALHGLSCERCRTEDLCVADAVTDLIDILTSDTNAEVRHKAVAALSRFLGRGGRAAEAITRIASDDPDAAIRLVARTVADRGQPHIGRRKAALRNTQRRRRSGH
jgi:HEAT repeat protein